MSQGLYYTVGWKRADGDVDVFATFNLEGLDELVAAKVRNRIQALTGELECDYIRERQDAPDVIADDAGDESTSGVSAKGGKSYSESECGADDARERERLLKEYATGQGRIEFEDRPHEPPTGFKKVAERITPAEGGALHIVETTYYCYPVPAGLTEAQALDRLNCETPEDYFQEVREREVELRT